MQAGADIAKLQEVRSSLTVISMAAMKQPHLVADRLDLLLKVTVSHGLCSVSLPTASWLTVHPCNHLAARTAAFGRASARNNLAGVHCWRDALL